EQGISGERVVPTMVNRMGRLLQSNLSYDWIIILGGTNDLLSGLSAEKIFKEGFSIRRNEKWYVYFLGLTGDYPAIKLALNHISNNGYYSCWFCKIRGIHTANKRQYYYQEVFNMRSINSYRNESKEAEVKHENHLQVDKAAHVALLVCAIRMLHGPKLFGYETCVLPHDLLSIYYRDHSKYYDNPENLVLHLHIHYSNQYLNYGSLNNTNCFAQESFLGAFAKNKHDDFDSQKDDADVENDVVTVDTQHRISTQSQFPHDSLARLNYESASDDSGKENEKYNEDDELSDQYVKSIKKKNTNKRKSTTDHMYEDTNLLRTVASSFGDFARKTMRLVFNAHELTTQILPPQRHYLARTSLNEKKFQLVNDAIRIKFKIDSTKYAAFYKNILRRKLSDFLIEERRRGLKRIGRDHIQNETMENSS
ncbi:unnamed protein product, partial [Adineta steineri]